MGAMNDLPATSEDLLARIAASRAALAETLRGIDRAALIERRDDAGWTALDHLAHIAAWERMIVAHLTDGSDHEIVDVDPARYAAMSLQQINDALHERTRGRSAGETLAEFVAAHSDIVALLASLPGEVFARPYWADDASGRTVMAKVAGDTYLHYAEHAEWIAALHGQPSA